MGGTYLYSNRINNFSHFLQKYENCKNLISYPTTQHPSFFSFFFLQSTTVHFTCSSRFLGIFNWKKKHTKKISKSCTTFELASSSSDENLPQSSPIPASALSNLTKVHWLASRIISLLNLVISSLCHNHLPGGAFRPTLFLFLFLCFN